MRSGGRVTLQNEARVSKLKHPSMPHSLLTISLSCSWPIASERLSALNHIGTSIMARPSVSTIVTQTATTSRHRSIDSTRTKRPRHGWCRQSSQRTRWASTLILKKWLKALKAVRALKAWGKDQILDREICRLCWASEVEGRGPRSANDADPVNEACWLLLLSLRYILHSRANPSSVPPAEVRRPCQTHRYGTLGAGVPYLTVIFHLPSTH